MKETIDHCFQKYALGQNLTIKCRAKNKYRLREKKNRTFEIISRFNQL